MKSNDQILLEKAYQRILEGVYDAHIFKAIFMAGPPGAGKTTIAQKLLGGSGLKSLNIDNFNELAIRKGEIRNGEISDERKKQSYEKVEKQKINWVDGRLGLLVDGSGRSIKTVLKSLKPLKALGYDTACILVNVDLKTAIERAKSRAMKQAETFKTKQGRTVPLDYHTMVYGQVQNNIPILKKLFGDNFFYVDNSPESTTNLDEIQKGINRFMSAPITNPNALEWIEQQKKQKNTLSI